MLEFADRNSLDLLSGRYPEIPKSAGAALLIEAEGDDVDAWEAYLSAAHADIDASWFAMSAKDRERFRQFRHSLPELVNSTVLQRGFLKMGTDYAVPIGQNRAMLAFYRERLQRELPGQYVIYGHIGDAHVHVNMLPSTQEQAAAATQLFRLTLPQPQARDGTAPKPVAAERSVASATRAAATHLSRRRTQAARLKPDP